MTDAVNMALNHKLQVQISETRAALQRITILERQLEEFGDHKPSCNYIEGPEPYHCNCGWLAAKEQSL